MPYQIIPLSKKADDLSLRVFDKLLAVAPIGFDSHKLVIWLCVCHCGNVVTRTGINIKKPGQHSCGCMWTKVRHGATKSKEYKAWLDMIHRCTRKTNKRFPAYGGRGITVCEQWLASFENFYQDMGHRPDGYSLDRIDNNGNYCPENCRWATASEQQNNKRANRLITYGGNTKTITEWSRTIGINVLTLTKRLAMGWPINKAFEEPVSIQHAISSSCRRGKATG